MKNRRVAILDGSHSLFYSKIEVNEPTSKLHLQPIPRIRTLVFEVLKTLVASGVLTSRVIPIEVGVICDLGDVRAVGNAMHKVVLQGLGLE